MRILSRIRALWAGHGDERGARETSGGGSILGLWMACGQREGLDMMRGRRLSYYPIGRGSIELLADGRVRYTTVNASGTYRRSGTYRFDARGRLRITIGEDAGVFRCAAADGVLRLYPERSFFRVAEKRLHRPCFRRGSHKASFSS